MVALIIFAALLIHLPQIRRYSKAARGQATSQIRADLRRVLATAVSIIAFGIGGVVFIFGG